MSIERDELQKAIFGYFGPIETIKPYKTPEIQDRELAEHLITAGYRKIFDGDCGLSGVKDPTDRDAAEAWMRWANLAMNEEIGAIGAMKQMLTELGYRKDPK